MAEDERTVEQVARETIESYGSVAVPVLRERAEQAELAAKAWRDIADAAERMLET